MIIDEPIPDHTMTPEEARALAKKATPTAITQAEALAKIITQAQTMADELAAIKGLGHAMVKPWVRFEAMQNPQKISEHLKYAQHYLGNLVEILKAPYS